MTPEEKEVFEFLRQFKQTLQSAVRAGIDITVDVDFNDWNELKAQIEKLKKEASTIQKNSKELTSKIDKLLDRVDKFTGTADVEKLILEGSSKLAKRLNDTFAGELPEKANIINAINLLQAYREKAFAIAASKPNRLPQLEFEAQDIKALEGTIEDLLGATNKSEDLINLVDQIDFANLTQDQQDKLDEINSLVFKVQESIGGVVKGTSVIKTAYTDFFEGRNLRERTRDVRDYAQETRDSFASIEVSGRGISSSVSSLFKFVSQAAFTIATENERRRQVEGESVVDPAQGKRVHRLVTLIGNRVQANFDQIDKVLKLMRAIIFPATLAIEFLFKALDEGAKSSRQVLELFGAQDINFGFKVDPKSFLNRIVVMNDALNATDADLNVTFQDRLDIFKEFIRSGGSIKSLGVVKQEWFSDNVIRDLNQPVAIAATYENLLGKSLGDIGSLLGKYTFESRMSMGQLEDLFAAVSQVKISDKLSPTSVILDSVLEITDRFGNILGSAKYNFALLSKVAKRTGLNEQQAAKLLSGFLSYAEGVNVDSANRLITLAGYRLDNDDDIRKLRETLTTSLNQVRGSLVSYRDTQVAKYTQDYDAVTAQIEKLDLSKNLVNSVSIQYGISQLATSFPQALLPLVLDSVDGQIDLTFGNRAPFYKNTVEGFNAALGIIAEPLGLNDEMIQMLIAAKFDKAGNKRAGDLDVSKLDLGQNLEDETKKRIKKFASDTALNVKSFSNQMGQLVEGVKAKFIGLLIRVTNFIQFFPASFKKDTSSAPAPVAPKPAPVAPKPSDLVIKASSIGVPKDVLGDRGLADRYSSLANLASPATTYTLGTSGPPKKVIDILADAAKTEGLPLATLLALAAQEKPTNSEYWTTHERGKSSYGLFSVQEGWGGWDKLATLPLPDKEKIALDPAKIAPIVAKQVKREIEEVRKVVTGAKWNLTEAQVQALGASRHNWPAILKMLENMKGKKAGETITPITYRRYEGDAGFTFTPLPRAASESDFEFIRRNTNAFLQHAEKSLNQQNTQGKYDGSFTMGSSYFENMLVSEAYAIKVLDEKKYTTQATLGLTLATTAKKAASGVATAAGPAPRGPARPPAVAAHSPGSATPVAGQVTRGLPRPGRLPSLPTARAPIQVTAGMIAGITGSVFEVNEQEKAQNLPYVFNRRVNYETLYLTSLNDLTSKWKQLYNGSA